MWVYEHTLEAEVTAEAIFALYRDVPGWPAWDAGLERAELEGSFTTGSAGMLSVAGQGEFAFRLLSVEEGRGFADATEIPGTGLTITFVHALEPLGNRRTRVTHRVEISGDAAGVMGPQIGPGITADVPEAMVALTALAAQSPALR